MRCLDGLAGLAGDGARPPPASQIERGCVRRAIERLSERIPLLCGWLGQLTPWSARTGIDRFWSALRKLGTTGEILVQLARDRKSSLLGFQENPKTPLQVLYRHWQEHGHGLPSISAVRRLLKARGHDRRSLRAGRFDTGPQKAFEAPAPNDLWMVDFATGPALREPGGKALATPLCVILDDHSRLVVHAAYHEKADTAAFHHNLKQAVLRRGLPHKLYTDQGKPFVSHHTRVVCANLGIRLLHAKPYHAWSKGKVERLIRTVQQDFEATLRLEGQSVHSLEELNAALSRWIETRYHLRVHSSTGMSPHQRFAGGPHALRHLEDPDGIDPLFYARAERVVRKDGTVTLGKTLYEVPLSLRALQVELRYDPVLMDRVEIWHKGSFQGLATKADLHLNSQTHNRSDNYERPANS